jgi:hypothetical protein
MQPNPYETPRIAEGAPQGSLTQLGRRLMDLLLGALILAATVGSIWIVFGVLQGLHSDPSPLHIVPMTPLRIRFALLVAVPVLTALSLVVLFWSYHRLSYLVWGVVLPCMCLNVYMTYRCIDRLLSIYVFAAVILMISAPGATLRRYPFLPLKNKS